MKYALFGWMKRLDGLRWTLCTESPPFRNENKQPQSTLMATECNFDSTTQLHRYNFLF